MDDFLLGVYQGELQTQCKFVVVGASLVNSQLQNLTADSTMVIWFGLQGMLVSAANASKLLWDSKTADDIAARQELRESVGVDEQSPLYSRQLRNDFEHFDERLETWFTKSANHIYVGRNIGPPNMIIVGNQPPDDPFGHFDPGAATVAFWERSVELNPLVAEAQRILGVSTNATEHFRAGPSA